MAREDAVPKATVLEGDDYVRLVKTQSTTPDTEIISRANLLASLEWVKVSDTWTYAAAGSITVPSDASTVYNKGDKLRLKQGGAYKYFYVAAVAPTTLTFTGGSAYPVANAAI